MHLKKHISIFNFNYLLGFFLMLAFIILLNFKIVDSIISQTIRFFFTTNFFFNLILYFFIPIFVITIIVLILVITHYTKKGIRVEAETVEIERKVDEFLVKLIFGKKLSDELITIEIKNFKKTIPFDEKYVKNIVLTKIITIKEGFNLNENDILVSLFNQFDFLEYSKQLLAKKQWYNKALGVHYIEKINYKSELHLIEPLLTHKNETLRGLSFNATLSLKEDIFPLLMGYKETITYASKIKIADILRQKKTTFSLEQVNMLLRNENDSIKSIAMLYVLDKNISISEDIIIELLNSKTRYIRKDIITLIRNLKLSHLEDQLFKSYHLEEIIRNKISIFKTLAEMGSEKSIFFALKTIEDPNIDSDIEFEAVRTIFKINPMFFEQFIISKFSEKETVKKIIAHINNPYLS
mgnify:FL=1|jgi:hypothetical protein